MADDFPVAGDAYEATVTQQPLLEDRTMGDAGKVTDGQIDSSGLQPLFQL